MRHFINADGIIDYLGFSANGELYLTAAMIIQWLNTVVTGRLPTGFGLSMLLSEDSGYPDSC